ncbi:Sel1 domain protein repeat-containing protein, partial [mine drainage metagenome]
MMHRAFAICALAALLAGCHPQAEIAKLDRREARQGNPVAENDLGVMYETGEWVPKSDVKAAKWYRRSAHAGDVHAQVNLGWLYQKGRGVPQSDARGLYWYKSAADQGDPVGEYN